MAKHGNFSSDHFFDATITATQIGSLPRTSKENQGSKGRIVREVMRHKNCIAFVKKGTAVRELT